MLVIRTSHNYINIESSNACRVIINGGRKGKKDKFSFFLIENLLTNKKIDQGGLTKVKHVSLFLHLSQNMSILNKDFMSLKD